MNREQAIDRLFSKARRYCREVGYDTKWVYQVSRDTITPQKFFEEYTYVVYACNFKVTHLKGLWKPLSEAYGNYRVLDGARRQTVLNVIDNERKWNAVHRTALIMQGFGWDEFRKLCLDEINSMTLLGFIGPVPKFHLARNLGFDVAKPDRWMYRIANKTGWESVSSMCEYLFKKHGLSVKETDIILWKYASDRGDTKGLRYIEGKCKRQGC